MKRILACILAGAAVLGLAACSYVPALTGLEMEKNELELLVGQTETVAVTTLTEADTEGFQAPIFHTVAQPALKVSFSSGDSLIAGVDETGCITALAPGKTSVVVTADDGKAAFEKEIPVTCFRYIDDLEQFPDALEIEAGTEHDLAEGFGSFDRWIALTASSDGTVAACDGPVIKAVNPGAAVVTLTLEDKTKELAVTCFHYLESLKDIPETLELDTGMSYDLMDSLGGFYKWNALSVSSDEGVARCEGAVVKAVGPGDCTVTVTLKNETKEISLHSRQAVKEFQLNHEALQGEEGSTVSVIMESWLPETANDGFDLTYTSSDEKVAAVDNDGTVRLLAPGKAVISAVNRLGARAECAVTVIQKKKIPNEGENGTGLPAGALTDPSSYDRSNPAVAAVLDMIGSLHACSDVAEAAAQAKGATGWVHGQLADGRYYRLLSPEGFLSIGTIVPYSQAKPGDILYYAEGGLGISHVAVYIGNGMAVHGNYGSDRRTKIASATYLPPTCVIHIG